MKNYKNLLLALTLLFLAKPLSAEKKYSGSNDTLGNVLIGSGIAAGVIIVGFVAKKGYDWGSEYAAHLKLKDKPATLEDVIVPDAASVNQNLTSVIQEQPKKTIEGDFSPHAVNPAPVGIVEKVSAVECAQNSLLKAFFTHERVATMAKTIDGMPERYADSENSNN